MLYPKEIPFSSEKSPLFLFQKKSHDHTTMAFPTSAFGLQDSG
jgi:hypothetical protein